MESMEDSEFFFDYVNLLYYKCHKINSNHGGSYTDSPDQIKNKKVAINLINKIYNKCFQYVVTVALNHEEFKKDLQRITKIKPFTNKYNFKEMNFPSEKNYWKKSYKNNVTIALNVLCAKQEEIYSACVLKHNSNCEKQVVLLMIPNGEKWHYLAVKNHQHY